MRDYYKIFEQIYEEPGISISGIAENTKLTRNSVAKYLKYMYEHRILVGPQLCMKPAVNYKEYVYLMNFEHPFETFERLKGFSHVLYHTVTFGDWNTMMITDKLLDFYQVKGFEDMIHRKMRGITYTPKPACTMGNWAGSVYNHIDQFKPTWTRYKDREICSTLPWSKNEWMIYYAFQFYMRKKVTSTLREIDVPYEYYKKWKKGLQGYCTVHTGFYPEGYENYMHYCFLFNTDYEESVIELFSLFPTTPFIMETGNQLLIFVALTTSDVIRNVFCTVYNMKLKEMIKTWRYAVVISGCYQ